MSSFSSRSIQLHQVISYAQDKATFCIGIAKSITRLEENIKQFLTEDFAINRFVFGFDSANTHLHGVLIEDIDLIDLLQLKLGFQVESLEVCHLGGKRILVFFVNKKVQQGLPIQECFTKDEPILEKVIMKAPDDLDTSSEQSFCKGFASNSILDNVSVERKNEEFKQEYLAKHTEKTTLAEKILEVEEQNQLVQQTLTSQFKGYQKVLNAELKLVLNARQKKAITYLKNHKKLTNRKFRDLFNVSHKTAHLELTELVDRGLLKRLGNGRSTRYTVSVNF